MGRPSAPGNGTNWCRVGWAPRGAAGRRASEARGLSFAVRQDDRRRGASSAHLPLLQDRTTPPSKKFILRLQDTSQRAAGESQIDLAVLVEPECPREDVEIDRVSVVDDEEDAV